MSKNPFTFPAEKIKQLIKSGNLPQQDFPKCFDMEQNQPKKRKGRLSLEHEQVLLYKRQSETQLQQQCVEWFRSVYPQYDKVFFAIPNGGKRYIATAIRLKKEGVVAGVADLFLSVPNPANDIHGLYIEMKVGENKQTQNQVEFQTEVEAMGYKYFVVKSYDQFTQVVESYLQ